MALSEIKTGQEPNALKERRFSASEVVTALRTLPENFHPSYFEIILGSKTEENVIPDLKANLHCVELANGESMFILNSWKPVELLNPKDRKLTKQLLLMGGRPQKLKYENDNFSTTKPYKVFINEDLEEQIVNGSYQIDWGHLAITWYSRTGYSAGDYPDTELCLRRQPDGNYSVELNIQGGLSPEEKVALENWYSSLSSQKTK